MAELQQLHCQKYWKNKKKFEAPLKEAVLSLCNRSFFLSNDFKLFLLIRRSQFLNAQNAKHDYLEKPIFCFTD